MQKNVKQNKKKYLDNIKWFIDGRTKVTQSFNGTRFTKLLH